MKLLRKLFGTKPKVEPLASAALPAVQEKAPKPVISLEVVSLTSDENELLMLASEGATSQLRQAAADKIERRDLLEQLAKTAKTKDKNVFKQVKTKLDVFKAEDARQAELEAQAARLCEKLEKHRVLEADALFKAKLALLQQEWEALSASLSHALHSRYQAALAVCEEKIQAQANAIAAEEERIALDQQARQLAAEAVANLQQLQQEVLAKAQLGDDDASHINLRLQELAQAMRLAANRALPMQQLTQAFEQGRQQLLNLLDHIKTSGTLTQLAEQISAADNSDHAKQLRHTFQQQLTQAKHALEELPELAQAAKTKVDQWFSQLQAREQVASDALRQVSELTRKGLWAAEQGFVRKARGIHKELQEKLASLGELPKGLQAKWEDFEAQLHKLGDWHEFAVTPKKEALVAQMQGLVDSTLAPDLLATRVHELQDSWKEVSKGGQQADDDLWQQFQQASAQAYAPCKEFFEAQATARDNNLSKRRELVAQLQSYMDNYHWDSADWKEVEHTLKVARQEWQTYWPVPRKAGNELQKTFEQLMEQLFGKISAEHEHNKQAKQAIIAEAKQLLEQSDLRAATDAAKQLQERWKTIGKSWHREDQQLWQAFRNQCDQLFSRRQQAFETAKQERQEHSAQAQNLIAQLQAFAALSAAELDAEKDSINASIEHIKTEFHALPLAREQSKNLHEQLQAALAAIGQNRLSARAHAQNQRWQQVFAAADTIRRYELAIINGSASEQDEQQAQAALAAEQRWPSGTLAALQARLSNASHLASNAQTNSDTLRLLCIRAEIMNNQPSPESDKALRMQYQVQQLQQAFGQRDSNIETLVLEWLTVGGVADSEYAALLARFNQQAAR